MVPRYSEEILKDGVQNVGILRGSQDVETESSEKTMPWLSVSKEG
jgi:hypothetical protein